MPAPNDRGDPDEAESAPARFRPRLLTPARLALFTVRHVAGIAVFVWLTLAARRAGAGDDDLWLLVAALGALYALTVVVAWVKLFTLYRKEENR